MNQMRLTIWEADLVLEVDLIYRRFVSKEREKELKKAKRK